MDNTLCTNINEAAIAGFNGATQWLPLSDVDSSRSQQSRRSQDIDYKSIMMYPGTAGGAVIDGVRQTVMYGPAPNDHDPLGGRQLPSIASDGDIRGLLEIYRPFPD